VGYAILPLLSIGQLLHLFHVAFGPVDFANNQIFQLVRRLN
jgi:hypothetical protein